MRALVLFGVVGYRDPVGVISPDATRLAYTEGRHIRVLPIGGGVPQTLPAGEGQIRYLAWAGNDTLIAEDAGADVRWQHYTLSVEGVTRARTALLDGARKSDGRSVVYAIGVDQESGTATSELREVRADEFDAEITHAEWLPSSATVIAIAKLAPGRHAIITLPITGGRPHVVHEFETEHDFAGLAASADGRMVAFTAPARDGFFQIFRQPIVGGDPPVQVTSDPSHKTQPAWSPDGARIAFTVWSYEAVFFMMQ